MTEENVHYLEQQIRQGWDLAHDPNLLLCCVSATEMDKDNGEKVLRLLRNAMARPDQSFVLPTPEGVVFAFSSRKTAPTSVPQTEAAPIRVHLNTTATAV
jgi:hypothetical protein